MTRIVLPNRWAPRLYQQRAWAYLAGGGRRACLAWHRRSGKDAVCLNFQASASHTRVGNYWHLLPKYAQARKAIWEAVNPHTGNRLIDQAFPVEVRRSTLDQEMMIRFKNGSTWQLAGSDNFDALVGSTPAGIVFSEFALANPAAWAYLAPILNENNGFAVFISTPRGKNHFWDMYRQALRDPRGWFAEALTVDDTGALGRDRLEADLRELQALHGEDYGRSLWEQEYYVSFSAALPGSIWGPQVDKAEKEGRVCAVPRETGYPVHSAWDLGRTDDTAIWFFQLVAGQIRVIDYFEKSGEEIPGLAAVLRERGYTGGTLYLPHDAKPLRLGMGGKTIYQQMQAENVGKCVLLPRADREEGIQAARATFKHAWFDADRCAKGVEHLRNYHRVWDDERKKFSDEPYHDESSHCADAWRYLSMSWKHPRAVQPDDTASRGVSVGAMNGMTFGAMKDAHFARMRSSREMLLH